MAAKCPAGFMLRSASTFFHICHRSPLHELVLPCSAVLIIIMIIQAPLGLRVLTLQLNCRHIVIKVSIAEIKVHNNCGKLTSWEQHKECKQSQYNVQWCLSERSMWWLSPNDSERAWQAKPPRKPREKGVFLVASKPERPTAWPS